MKKLLVIVMALALVLGMAGTALAAQVTTSTITINSPNGDITGRLFNAYQLFTVTETYDVSDGAEPPTYTTHYNYAPTQLLKDAVAGLAGFDLEGDTTDEGYTKAVKTFLDVSAENKANFAKAVNDAIAPTTTSYPLTVNGAGNQATATDVPYGYYIILEDITGWGADDYKNATPMLFALDTTAIEINLKADFYEFEKTEVDEDGLKIDNSTGYDIGDTVYYKLETTYPNITDATTVATHTFSDAMSTGLEYNEDVEIFIDGATTALDIDAVNAITAGTITLTPKADDKGFDLVIDYLKLKGDYDEGDAVVVKYSATVTSAALALGLDNNATLNFSNDPNQDGMKDDVTVYTYGFDILKINTSETPLKDAEFEVYRKGTTTALKFKLTQTAGTATPDDLTDDVWTYLYDENGSTVLVSDANGEIKVWGLAAGEYEIKETKAPAGYNLLIGNEEVEIEADGAEFVAPLVTITNVSGVELPSAGGMGTALFTIAGIAVMAGAAFVLMVSKKRLFN